MIERYVAFDVETPNHENNRMCSIGITVIDDFEITESFYYLIDPGTYFDFFNIELTGITPEMVCGKGGFRSFWEQAGEIMLSGTLVAHNAPFDMSVLSKCLRDYDITAPRYLGYACTCQMGRRVFPELSCHKLNVLCDCLGIDLSHHNAASDALACAKLLLSYKKAGFDIEKYIKRYDVLNCKTLK